MEIRHDANQLDNTIREGEYPFENNKILTEKDTNLPNFGKSTFHTKSQLITAISACVPIPDPTDKLDTSGSTLNTKETGPYGVSPYENLTPAILETDYGLLFEADSNAFRSRERSYSVIHASIGSINTPNSQENYQNKCVAEFASDTSMSSLTAFDNMGPILQPNSSFPVLRQPIAELPKPAPVSEPDTHLPKQKNKKIKKLNRSQSVYALDPTNWRTAMLNSWYSIKNAIPTKPKAQFSDRPIWLMGVHYMDTNPPIKHTSRQIGGKLDDSEILPDHLIQFVRDFQTRIWITYRKNFSSLDRSNLTSDCGWGCMIRTGQMMLANGLISHRLGRDWRLDDSDNRGIRQHIEILQWFLDIPGSEYPFSIHNLCRLGIVSGKKPGDWYGPSQVSFVLRDALCEAKHYHPENFENLHIYIARDCTIYRSEVAALMNVNEFCPNGDSNTAIIIYIPVRLGKDNFNQDYAHCVKQFLALPYSLGMIGGKPKHSLYFLGFQGDSLICLDPHVSQSLVKNIQREYHTYHCPGPKKLSCHKLDPSATLGFYCRSYQEFLDFCDQAYSIMSTVKSEIYHMFSILEKEDTNNLTMSISTEHIIRLEKTHSQKSDSSTNSQLMPEDFFETNGDLQRDSDATPEDDDYIVVSFT
ncbi:Cysteine protease ATG4D-like [Oopsacas minuta]|uniref:Cysteine protease n=1 Tax=Oopsacas minuta TaxID=111878 RepID=A0AAV7K710_9METZ|nr:Cysteine protease ATG4D-like [Oopsacas minuta]